MNINEIIALATVIGGAAVKIAGSVSIICTALAQALPKGSRVGKFFARVGADVKGHNE